MIKSIRHEILAALNGDPMTLDELDANLSHERRKINDNLLQAVKDKLVARSKDGVTGLPLYSILPAGKERLAAGVGSAGGKKPAEKIVKKDPFVLIEDEMPPADPVLLSSANRMLSERLEEIYKALDVSTHREALDAIKLLHEIEQQLLAEKQKPRVISKTKPLYWIVAGAKYDTEAEARQIAESAAIGAGCNIPVCAVVAECKAVVQWKESA